MSMAYRSHRHASATLHIFLFQFLHNGVRAMIQKLNFSQLLELTRQPGQKQEQHSIWTLK